MGIVRWQIVSLVAPIAGQRWFHLAFISYYLFLSFFFYIFPFIFSFLLPPLISSIIIFRFSIFPILLCKNCISLPISSHNFRYFIGLGLMRVDRRNRIDELKRRRGERHTHCAIGCEFIVAFLFSPPPIALERQSAWNCPLSYRRYLQYLSAPKEAGSGRICTAIFCNFKYCCNGISLKWKLWNWFFMRFALFYRQSLISIDRGNCIFGCEEKWQNDVIYFVKESWI